MNEPTSSGESRPRYVWPWFVAVAVLAGIIIAVFAIRAEANRVKLQRDLQMPASEK